jgi:RNA polymerase sigma factor (sigma-70 family)
MDTKPLDNLLDKLNGGDDAAAGQAFLAFEPYLRMVVRRHLSAPLRAKFDSEDIVLSVWVDVVKGLRRGNWRFADTAHLRAFLVKLTRNRFLNRLRRHRRALATEQPLHDGTGNELASTVTDGPSEAAQANDLWEQLLALCPPAHRSLLHLRRQGLPLAELAARTGLHESSVRRIFYDLAKRFARQRRAQDLPAGAQDDTKKAKNKLPLY